MQSKTGLSLLAFAAALALFVAGLLRVEPSRVPAEQTEAPGASELPAAAIRARVQVGMPFFSFARLLPAASES